MKVLIINQSEVPQLLPMSECMDVMAEALKALAQGNAILPLRPVMWLPEKVGALGMMPSYEHLNWQGLESFDRSQYALVEGIDAEEWRAELGLHDEFLGNLGERLPKELESRRKQLHDRLGA